MIDRFKNILTLLSSEGYKIDMGFRRGSPYVINGFQELPQYENTFLLELDLSPLCYMEDTEYSDVKEPVDKTLLQLYPPAPDGDVFTIRIKHVFGRLQTTGMDLDSFSRQMFTFLNKNIGSFAGTGAYLGIDPPDKMFASLNCMLPFLVKWSDDDIANILALQLSTMHKALELYLEGYLREASITILKRLG